MHDGMGVSLVNILQEVDPLGHHSIMIGSISTS